MTKKYFISRSFEEDINPEEMLADSISQHSKVEAPVRLGVFPVFYFLIFLVVAGVAARSFKLQIVDGNYYSALAERNSFTRYHLASLRGIISSNDGVILADNRPVFELIAINSHLPSDLDELSFQINNVAKLIGADIEELNKKFKDNKSNSIFTIARDIDKRVVLEIEQSRPRGIYAVSNYARQYNDGEVFSQVLGHTSGVTEKYLDTGFYIQSDKVGQLGVEEKYEEYLRGQRGTTYFKGENDDPITEDPKEGNRLVLNINFEMQKKLFQSLDSVLRSEGLRRGSAIVQNPKTGEVLALVSLPSYDNNIFENYFKSDNAKRAEAILDDGGRPMFNRVISGRFSPGSTIKPLFALAALKEKVVDTSTLIYSAGAITIPSDIDPNVVYTFRDWKVHGWTDIYKAIAHSVDVYFYAIGGGYQNIVGLGIDRIYKYLTEYMADKTLGIDLMGEIKGFVPSRAWKKEVKGEGWFRGDTYNISIGQGDLLVTPLWINSYIGAIANGGSIMQPLVVKKVLTPGGELILENKPKTIGKLDFSKEEMDVIRQGMKRTVEDGTATLLQSVPVKLGAKTGTTQISGGQLNALLTVFGPHENPEIVVTIIAESVGDKQGLALRVAKSFLEWYFSR